MFVVVVIVVVIPVCCCCRCYVCCLFPCLNVTVLDASPPDRYSFLLVFFVYWVFFKSIFVPNLRKAIVVDVWIRPSTKQREKPCVPPGSLKGCLHSCLHCICCLLLMQNSRYLVVKDHVIAASFVHHHGIVSRRHLKHHVFVDMLDPVLQHLPSD